MKAETNGYTQLCDKCHRLMRGEEVQRIAAPEWSIYGMSIAWYGANNTWLNQVCNNCHLALRLEGAI